MDEDAAVERTFVALETEAELSAALRQRDQWRRDASPVVTLSDMLAFLHGSSARPTADLARRLLVDPVAARGFRTLVGRVSVAVVPSAAAAATGRASERRGDGVLIRLVPSRSTSGQTYVIVEWDDSEAVSMGDGGRAGPSALVLLPPGDAPLKLDLPLAVDGRTQVLVEDRSDIGIALGDPATELVLT